MKKSDYARFINTFEAAHGKQQPSPFSTLLSGQTHFQTINKYLEHWQISAEDSRSLLNKIKQWMANEVDPEIIENDAQIPETYLLGLRELGCLRAKIPEQYGGMGVSQCSFSRILELTGSYSEVLALVISVQQLGVAQGLLSLKKLESTSSQQARGEKLRKKYLKKLASNATGAFCLTTPETGSDPSRLQTIARVTKDDKYFELSGDNQAGGKLFTTLGTIADVYIMLAVVLYPNETLEEIEPRKRITAFIVDRDLPGISVKALDFCGWHGLPNAAIQLDQVRIPAENQVGEIGDGLKIAFMNLGSGRINIAAISLGMMKQLQRISRWWGVERIQGGKAIAEHELNSRQLVNMNASVYAAESFLQFVSALADKADNDIRLEAAILKLFTSHALVEVADETLQLRGGRGYESYASQLSRGETAVPVERLFRSARMMKIGEGGSNVLQLYVMRCLLDDFLKDYTHLLSREHNLWRKFGYFLLTGKRFISSYLFPCINNNLSTSKQLQRHFRYIVKCNRAYKRLFISKFAYEYLVYFIKLGKNHLSNQSEKPILKPDKSFELRQVLLGHCAQIAMYLSVMSVTCLRAEKTGKTCAIELADEFCLQAEEKIDMHFMQIKNHCRKREQILKVRSLKTLDSDYAATVEQNIIAFDLPGIKQPKIG